MGLDLVPTGKNPPDEINVIIEIPKDAEPVKYEVDKASGAIFVDRILSTPMRYPCNYGYVPVGVLKMTDEAGSDEKLIAVPLPKIFSGYAHVTDIEQVSQHWLERIGHFFEHYKDLEKGKWVKLDGFGGAAEAKQILLDAMARYEATADEDKPKF